MLKTATFICIGLCVVAAQALAGPNTRFGGTVTVASASGLYVRAASPAAAANLPKGNVCGSAVNTEGVTRATRAVKIDGRVFLTGGRSMDVSHRPLAAVTLRTPAAPVRKKSPCGLGVLLARLFGLAGSARS